MNKVKKLFLFITLIITLTSGVFAYRVIAADTANLTTALNEVQSAMSTQNASDPGDPHYQVNSYQAFLDSINLLGGTAGIQAVIDDPLSDQATIDQYVEDINTALAGLILDDTYNSTLLEFTTAEGTDLTIYTDDSVDEFEDEMNRINTVLNTATAGETAIQNLSQDISNALTLLVLIGDKEDLILLNQLLIKAYYEDINLYTTSSHNNFKAVCDSFGSYLYVNSIIISTNVTQTEVDTLESQIEDALDTLVLLVDNSNLLSTYYQLIETDISIYTQNSRDAYNAELDRLYQIIIGKELDATTAESVLIDLSDVEDLLVPLADYSELRALYDSLNIYREEDYSVSSYASFNDAKENAANTLLNLNATQEEIESAIDYLETTIDELNLTIKTIYIVEEETFSILEYVTLGQSSIVGYLVDDENIVTIDSDGVVVGLDYGKTTIRVNLSNGAIEIIDIFVTAKLKTATYILIFSVPAACVGLGALLVYSKKSTWTNIFKTVANIFKKKNT